jgi:hypothetical protein
VAESVYSRTLHKAAELVGGRAKLCRYLKVPAAALEKWLGDEEVPPTPIFLMAVDLVVEEAGPAASEPGDPPAAQDCSSSGSSAFLLLVQALLLVLCAFALPLHAIAQQTGLVGTWTLVSSADSAGKKSTTLGQNPRGTLIFAPDGHYALVMARAGLPRFLSNTRDRASDDENRAVVAGSFAHSGRYTVDEPRAHFTWKIEASTFPNWENSQQIRSFKISGDELSYLSATAQGGQPEAVWRRAK